MTKQEVIISHDLNGDIERAIRRCPHDRLFVLTDTTTLRLCWPLVGGLPSLREAHMITIGDTDENKTLASLTHVWTALQQGSATRHSLLLNLGGGMVTDLGGFAASTFKRGMAYINVPTTLLSQVDASVGGKTGINFGGLKNEIGVFNCAATVILSTDFLRSLDMKNLLSGYDASARWWQRALPSRRASWSKTRRNKACARPSTSATQPVMPSKASPWKEGIPSCTDTPWHGDSSASST